ncbi:peptidase U32 [bacterium (Candidatus Howlettbacteria) CG_4_10_14_3_um_filter_37_10]|nr:MAG: peptidase U32 [bacterium (Candidatus Howlettbacteria) CG23_combo_of_CG06-09_8_20_14_all_37_9]PIX99076.1 MAG: peptidase U32 [bacterium (Candidatus Howlettbacteria) CG_4_10_14_3_um_filter_37_10]PJB05677.1 MAG: peptidase U32 [bacterium (Candidatus Howlettbacteria) CG_4_9_14_3_um_filter_37_10]
METRVSVEKIVNFLYNILTMKSELILPAGDLYKAKIAYLYGANACYGGLAKYSLRKAEVDFDFNTLKEAIDLAHSLGKKFYVTFNIFAHNYNLEKIEEDIKKIAAFGPDAIIASDPGVINFVRENSDVPIHLSTQANTTNWQSVKFWKDLGVKRIVLARELTTQEIKEIHNKVPDIELEVFVHGAMCVSYSGRCLLSAVMTGREANQGDCAQPCRWLYKGQIEERLRPGEFFPIEEDEKGTYIFNSKDLRLIDHLDKLAEAGVTGFKVEGRNKSEYYVASIAYAYKHAIEGIKKGKLKAVLPELLEETEKINYRGYTTGFLLGKAKEGEVYPDRVSIRKYNLLGVIEKNEKAGAKLLTRNQYKVGDDVEVLTPDEVFHDKILDIFDKNGQVAIANPGTKDHIVWVKMGQEYSEFSMIRKKI